MPLFEVSRNVSVLFRWRVASGTTLLMVGSLSGCPADSSPLPDASQCDRDSDCRDDGLYCNGTPHCQEVTYDTSRGPWTIRQCVNSDPPCASQLCTEDRALDRAVCSCAVPDADGDGQSAIACGGDDCDDSDSRRYPGAHEVCDAANLDEDCDPTTFGNRDRDGDGALDATCCNGTVCGDDCNDSQANIHPGSTEACNSLDDDCDGAIDEGVLAGVYRDQDGDGFGAGEPSEECAGITGYSPLSGDCDDTDPFITVGTLRCKQGGSTSDVEECVGDWIDDTCIDDGLCVPQPDGTGVCLPGSGGPQCSDGIDNDGDGYIDWSDPDCTSPLDNTEAARKCSNGIDDDGDGLVDFPNDPGCSSSEDNNEADPATAPACSNGIDDDNDGAVDYAGGSGDPGCTSAADNSERQADGPTCDNGIDDDMDGPIDFPADKSCASRSDDEIQNCDNGIDDDGDGLIDFPDDPGCSSAADDNEREPNGNLPCDNGIDDDVDGVADYPADPGCTGPTDSTEN